LFFKATQEIVYRDEPDPEVGPGEVTVEMEVTGTCGSNMHAYPGKDARRGPPLILGHKVVGKIIGGPFFNPDNEGVELRIGRGEFALSAP